MYLFIYLFNHLLIQQRILQILLDNIMMLLNIIFGKDPNY